MGARHEIGVEVGWIEGNTQVGALTVAALLRGHARASLRHRLKTLQGTAWGKIAEAVADSNGAGASRLRAGLKGLQAPGISEEETRQGFLAQIAKFDGMVDAWLELDPEFHRRSELPIKNLSEVEGMMQETLWLWPNWLPRGYLSMIAGRPGAGKSYLSAWIAGALLGHYALPDGYEPTKLAGKILWLDTEGTHALLIQRLKRLEIPLAPFFWPLDPKNPSDPFPAVNLGSDRWVGIVADIAIREKPDWIVCDSLRGAHSGDENSSELQEMLQKSTAIARDIKSGFTFVHHLRKAAPGEPPAVEIDRIRGSSAIVAMMRTVIALDSPDPSSKMERIRVIKSNLGPVPDALGLQIDGDGIRVSDDVPTTPKMNTLLDRAVEFLRARLREKPVKAEELVRDAEGAGITKRTLYRAKEKMGVVSVKLAGHWEWSLPVDDEPERKDWL